MFELTYWHDRYGVLTARDSRPWHNSKQWFAAFTDKVGTVVNLPLSEVHPYNFHDGEMFVVVNDQRDYAEEAFNQRLMHEE